MNPRFGHFRLLLTLPVLLGTIALVASSLMMVAGKVTVTVRGDRAMVFTGIGPLGWRRRFRWSEITAVEEDQVATGSADCVSYTPAVALVGATRIKFGIMLSPKRRRFIIQVLRKTPAVTDPEERAQMLKRLTALMRENPIPTNGPSIHSRRASSAPLKKRQRQVA